MNQTSRTHALFCLIGLLASLLLASIVLAARRHTLLQTITTSYTPLSGVAEWEGNWEFSELGADPSQACTERVTIPFVGTDFALQVRRGNYRGYFFVSVDGEPANRLPREERGAYLVLTSPDCAPQVVTIPIATGLNDGPHVAVVVAERGWDQWPLAGWSVSRTPDTTAYRWALVGLGAPGLACLGGVVWWGTRSRRQKARDRSHPASCIPRPASRVLHPASLLAPAAILIAAATFYFSPWLPLTLISGLTMAALVLLRLDLGLALVAATAPFYLHPRPLLGKTFSMAEIAMLLCLASWGVRQIGQRQSSQYSGANVGQIANLPHLPRLIERIRQRQEARGKRPKTESRKHSAPSIPHSPFRVLHAASSLDLAALFFVLAATASTCVAEYQHVALRELRVLVLEPALFYLMLRTSHLDDKDIWRIVDFFVAGAIVVSLIGLVQYALGVNVITAEQGFRRLRSVYGSPNSVGLYLGRVLPVLVAVTLFGGSRGRRVAYGLAVVPLGLAVLFSFSKGALILGIPISLLVLGLLASGPWLWASLGTLAAATVAAVPLLRTPRFASLLDTQSGTTFFRLQLWRSSWTMFLDHPWLGVGPDNFLYHYRSRYILPAAWQERNISQAHNILLDYATRMGIAGLVAGAWLQAAFWRLALPLRRTTDPDRRALALGLMGSMANFLAHGLVDASHFLIDLAFAFFLTLGLVQWLASETRMSRRDEWHE